MCGTNTLGGINRLAVEKARIAASLKLTEDRKKIQISEEDSNH